MLTLFKNISSATVYHGEQLHFLFWFEKPRVLEVGGPFFFAFFSTFCFLPPHIHKLAAVTRSLGLIPVVRHEPLSPGGARSSHADDQRLPSSKRRETVAAAQRLLGAAHERETPVQTPSSIYIAGACTVQHEGGELGGRQDSRPSVAFTDSGGVWAAALKAATSGAFLFYSRPKNNIRL
ncbi:hypothetical protein chiPu_0014366 [Chiloscyllium punctatum]|uniref:Uncharacterized protein n=1 Tax=Chiloscyllium punctatum TaxID=137246 RepID=A0A401SZR8_CHIPU|nr:hypothetical protein [Chiloscyllium punctatum]